MADVKLIEADFVAEGAAERVDVEGFPPLAVVKVNGEFFVCDDTCTHGQASLSDGYVDGEALECPWHNAQFCLRTGAVLSAPAVEPIKIYPVTVKDGFVCIPGNMA